MNSNWEQYNTLPTLEEADNHFKNREGTFTKLRNILSNYGNMYGVCLVHTHCLLSDGEIMLESDNVSEPVPVSDAESFYGSSWLLSGEPYEFTKSITDAPPTALLREIRRVVGDVGVLGLYYARSGDGDETRLEWTKGRKNLVKIIDENDESIDAVETAWELSEGQTVKTKCKRLCAKETSAAGGNHLGYKEHTKIR